MRQIFTESFKILGYWEMCISLILSTNGMQLDTKYNLTIILINAIYNSNNNK